MFRIALMLLCSVVLVSCGSGSTRRAPSVEATQISTGGNPSFRDADFHPEIGSYPSRFPIHGVDVSKWQTGVNWRQARNAGISFAFIKATEGADYADPMFRSHWQGAQAAGIRVGAYHFYYFCRSPETQANWFIRNVPKTPGMLPPVLDLEWNHHSSCKYRPNGAKARRDAQRFMDIVEAHYGIRPIIYTTPGFDRDTQITRLPSEQYWLRSVADRPHNIYQGRRWHFWQYTGTGIVPGFPKPVDINVFAGTREAWAEYRP